MKKYKSGAHIFCDFHFGGKPSAKVLKVITPGNGKDTKGKVLVQLTETVGAYRKGEKLELTTFQAVPKKQEFRKPYSYFRWVDTCYEFVH